MAATIQSGPVIVSGDVNVAQQMDPDVGPSLTYQGGHLLDVRQEKGIGAAPGLPGYKFYGAWCSPYVTQVDAVPQALGTARIAALQAVTNGTPVTLVTAQGTGVSPNIPLIPFGSAYTSANKVTTNLALDFGFTTCTVVSGTAQLTSIPSGGWKFFKKGQKLIVSGAGSSATSPLFTTVTATPAAGATTVNVDVAPGQSASGLQVGTADPTGLAAWPYAVSGVVAMADPTQMLGRAVSITGVTSTTAKNFTVVGYDVWGQVQTEVIAFAGGAVTTNGKKAFKYIQSVTPNTTDALNHSVGTTDIFGFTMRSDFWEYVNVYFNGAFITVSTGWTVSDATDPATTTTGDSRGTYAVQSASDGSKRLAIFMSVPIYNLINATQLAYKTMYGVTPV